MEKNYNYGRKKMFLPEYGRHIHEMVDYLSTIEDREQRNRQARAVIAVMANINPMLRDSADFDQKLWDHLFMMSDFKLDVDSPYPIPTRDALTPVPEKLSYPSKNISLKHYGKNIEKMILALKDITDNDAREETLGNIARYMRTKSYEYNQEHPNNDLIANDIRRMSRGTVEVGDELLGNIKNDYKPQHFPNRQKKNGQQNNRNVKSAKSNKPGNNPKQRYAKQK